MENTNLGSTVYPLEKQHFLCLPVQQLWSEPKSRLLFSKSGHNELDDSDMFCISSGPKRCVMRSET